MQNIDEFYFLFFFLSFFITGNGLTIISIKTQLDRSHIFSQHIGGALEYPWICFATPSKRAFRVILRFAKKAPREATPNTENDRLFCEPLKILSQVKINK